jgi:predicted Na+-dependent transporter
MLLVCYLVVFVLAAFVPAEYLAVAFDSGGVFCDHWPITVPFIMALGIGMAAVRGGAQRPGRTALGLVALCSVGPILSVLLLGMFFPRLAGRDMSQAPRARSHTAGELIALFAQGFPIYARSRAGLDPMWPPL